MSIQIYCYSFSPISKSLPTQDNKLLLIRYPKYGVDQSAFKHTSNCSDTAQGKQWANTWIQRTYIHKQPNYHASLMGCRTDRRQLTMSATYWQSTSPLLQ